jgi:proline dehydrogenase
MRTAILVAARSGTVAAAMRRFGMRLGASRFVAGETIDTAIDAVRRLNQRGLAASLTLLGEYVSDRARVEAVVSEQEAIMRRLAAEQLDANIGFKLTNVGLSIDEALALTNADRLASLGDALAMRIRIDMEESFTVDATLRIYRALLSRGHRDVEVALQSYLRRTEADLRDLLPLSPTIRLVKGAYLESASVAYPDKRDVDASYARLLERSLGQGAYVCVATHDDRLIERALALTRERAVGRDRYEFQMLYGIRTARQVELAKAGHRVLISVPYGPEWYPYLMRRLAERPANVLFFLSNFFRR